MCVVGIVVVVAVVVDLTASPSKTTTPPISCTRQSDVMGVVRALYVRGRFRGRSRVEINALSRACGSRAFTPERHNCVNYKKASSLAVVVVVVGPEW